MTNEEYNVFVKVPKTANKIDSCTYGYLMEQASESPHLEYISIGDLSSDSNVYNVVPGLGKVRYKTHEIWKDSFFDRVVLKAWNYEWGDIANSFNRKELEAITGTCTF